MKYISILFLIYLFLKSFYYGIYEINDKKNKLGGIAIIFLSIIGLVLPLSLLFIIY